MKFCLAIKKFEFCRAFIWRYSKSKYFVKVTITYYFGSIFKLEWASQRNDSQKSDSLESSKRVIISLTSCIAEMLQVNVVNYENICDSTFVI